MKTGANKMDMRSQKSTRFPRGKWGFFEKCVDRGPPHVEHPRVGQSLLMIIQVWLITLTV